MVKEKKLVAERKWKFGQESSRVLWRWLFKNESNWIVIKLKVNLIIQQILCRTNLFEIYSLASKFLLRSSGKRDQNDLQSIKDVGKGKKLSW